MRCVLTTCVLLVGAACALAERSGDPQGPSSTSATTPSEPAQKAQELADELAPLVEGMTPQKREALVQRALKMRLGAELKLVEAEIRDGLGADDARRAAALKVLADAAPRTAQDAIDLACKAYAAADERFGKAWKLFEQGSFEEAARAMPATGRADDATYLGAARRYLLGMCLWKARADLLKSDDPEEAIAARKKVWTAIESWQELVEVAQEKLIFAPAAAIACAEAYERLGRGIYAMGMYSTCLKNYAVVLDKRQIESISAAAQRLSRIYNDPMASVSQWMGQVRQRLDRADSGPQTQEQQRQIVALLEDLIKTQEEASRPPPPPPRNPPPVRPDPRGDPVARDTPGRPPADARAVTPMPRSILPPADPTRRTPRGRAAGSEPADDLPNMPAERQRLIEASRKVMSERYRYIIRDYFRELAGGE
jgi:hypothetical protein